MQKSPETNKDLNVIKQFCLLFIPLLLLISAVTYYSYRVESKNDRIIAEVNEIQFLHHVEHLVLQDFKVISTDLKALIRSHTLQELLNGNSSAQSRLTDDWLVLAETKAIYDQVRFLDVNGQEIVRIDYHNGQPVIVPAEQLQNKYDRYYFLDTLKLEKEKIFVSPLDLNIEHGQIEQPLKPMIRFGAPVYDQHGEKRGIVLLNYLGKHLINWFTGSKEDSIHRQRMLLNADGYWLAGPYPARTWGFMYGNDETFANMYPEAWAQIQANDHGQFVSKQGLFTFTRVHPLDEDLHLSSTGSAEPFERSKDSVSAQNYNWIAVTFIPAEILASSRHSLVTNLVWLFSFFTLITGTISWLLAVSWARRKQANKALIESKETTNLLLNSTAEGICGIDADGLCTFCNQSAIDLLGYKKQELIGQHICELIAHTGKDGSHVPEGECALGKVIAGGKPSCNDDTILWRADGSWFSVESRALPITQDGQTVGAVFTFLDITEKKKLLEQRMRNSQLASLGELAAGVAHEINNPIGGVINYAQILLNKHPEGSKDRDVLSRIIKESERVVRIVQTLLSFSQKERAGMAPLSIEKLLEDPLHMVGRQLDRAGISLDVEIEDDLPKIFGNEHKLGQVMLNLISNSRYALNEKYPDPHPDKILRISARKEYRDNEIRLLLTVWDQGCGIEKGHLPRIFTPFFTTKAAGVGIGLGLSTLHDILVEHGATVSIESDFGYFTKVEIEFPIVE